MHTNKYIYTFTPHTFTFKISNMSVVDYNFKSRRGQRADENSSRGRGVRKKHTPKVTIALAARADTSRSDLERKTNKNKLQHSPRGHTPRTATKKYENKTKTDYNTRHRSDWEEKKEEKNGL